MVADKLAELRDGQTKAGAPIGAGEPSQAEAAAAAKLATMERGANQHASIEATSQAQAAQSLNARRSTVQRASVAAKLAEYGHGGDRSKAQICALKQAEAAKLATMKRGDNQHAPNGATSQGDAAKALNVSRSAVQRAGTPPGNRQICRLVAGRGSRASQRQQENRHAWGARASVANWRR